MNDDPDPYPRVDDATGEPSFIERLKSWMRARRRRNGENSVRETLEDLIDEREEEDIPLTAHERRLLTNILRLRDETVYDVMVPVADIIAVEAETPLRKVIHKMAETGHSRLPVYRRSLDDVLGMVHIKDILAAINDGGQGSPRSLSDLARRLLFVSPSMRVLDLLLEMRLARTHMALVVDEYGGVDGLVTIEDLVEQIVGEIEEDPDDGDEPRLVPREDGAVLADSRFDLEEFERRYGRVFSEEDKEDTDTLGGLVFRLAGKVPGRGALVIHPSGIEFEVVEADPRRIRRLLLRNLPRPMEHEAEA